MKLNVTVEIVGLDTLRPSDIRNLPKDLQQTLQKMPQVEHASKSILTIDGFPPKLIDNKAISPHGNDANQSVVESDWLPEGEGRVHGLPETRLVHLRCARRRR